MNHLQAEKSPYLMQHLENPVDWYPWGPAAFQRSRDENRLIFLSIGYSTCHWCHVMAHESFEDQDVAALLNQDFICIKVDREERPDIDQVYMEVCQRLTRRGGWPLTILMTPSAQPFYAATYIPKHGRHGQPGLTDLLPWVANRWRTDPGYLAGAANEIVAELQRSAAPLPGRTLNQAVFSEAERTLKKSFDPRNGGFGPAPKFPRPHDLTFLLRRYAFTGDEECLTMVDQTLWMMRSGGIYDQLGYGFHRYATDEKWLVPHFEKMLYDQAGLVLPYLEAWQISGRGWFADTAREILTYLLRDMKSPRGAFYSAEDADSEGEEGKFYLWTKCEILDLLGTEAETFCNAYHVQSSGNFRDEMTGRATGRNILHLSSDQAEDIGRPSPNELSASRAILFAEREKRPRPHLDDKIITAWNGMVISALARAGRVLEENRYIECAGVAADFILSSMRGRNGRLLRRYRQGEAAVEAFSEDYAFLARGLLDLYAADFAAERVAQAVDLANLLKRLFLDAGTGRLYDTSSDAERLLFRPSSTYDGATPSASSIALEVFSRLFLITGDPAWRSAAEGLLGALSAEVDRYPAGYTQTLQSADWLLKPGREIVIVGVRGEPETEAMLSVARRNGLCQTVVLFKSEDDTDALSSLAPFVKEMPPSEDRAVAYVCDNFTCREPVGSADVLAELLQTEPE